MARLTITTLARVDLTEIRDYIARDNPTAARRLIERLRDKARAIAECPGIGRSREGDLQPNLLSFPVGIISSFISLRKVVALCFCASFMGHGTCQHSFKSKGTKP